jgi:hypothetical protein
MHNVIAEHHQLSFIGMVDHKDRNKLNNQKSNFRSATAIQNTANQSVMSNNTSNYRGVAWHKKHQKWIANIMFAKKRIHLGYFQDKIEAAKAYDKAALYYFGEFAVLNLKEGK